MAIKRTKLQDAELVIVDGRQMIVWNESAAPGEKILSVVPVLGHVKFNAAALADSYIEKGLKDIYKMAVQTFTNNLALSIVNVPEPAPTAPARIPHEPVPPAPEPRKGMCPSCQGSGLDNEDTCRVCKGTGEVEED